MSRKNFLLSHIKKLKCDFNMMNGRVNSPMLEMVRTKQKMKKIKYIVVYFVK